MDMYCVNFDGNVNRKIHELYLYCVDFDDPEHPSFSEFIDMLFKQAVDDEYIRMRGDRNGK